MSDAGGASFEQPPGVYEALGPKVGRFIFRCSQKRSRRRIGEHSQDVEEGFLSSGF